MNAVEDETTTLRRFLLSSELHDVWGYEKKRCSLPNVINKLCQRVLGPW